MLLEPKEVSLDPSLKVETPTVVELPNNENKLFDEEDHVMFKHIYFHYPVRMRKKKSSATMSGNMLFNTYSNSPPLPEGKSLRKWVKYYQWNKMIYNNRGTPIFRIHEIKAT